MKYLVFLLSFSVHAQTTPLKSALEEVATTFKEDQLVVRMLSKAVVDLNVANQAMSDKNRFIVADRAFQKSSRCADYLLDDESKPLFQGILDKFMATTELDGFDEKEAKLLSEPEIKKTVLEGIDELPEEKWHELCSEKIPENVIKEITSRNTPPATNEVLVSKDSLKIFDEIKTLSKDPLILRMLKYHVEAEFNVIPSMKDKKLYVEAQKNLIKSSYCVDFLLDEDTKKKFSQMTKELKKQDAFVGLDKKEEDLMKDREVLGPIVSSLLVPKNKYYENCSETIPPEKVADIRKTRKEENAKKEASYKPRTFEEFHPLHREMLVYLRDKLNPYGFMKKMKADQQALVQAAKTMLPIFEVKAELETLKVLEEKCPGKTAEIWKLCEGKKYYTDSQPFFLPFPKTHRVLCLADNQKLVVPSCLSEEMLLRKPLKIDERQKPALRPKKFRMSKSDVKELHPNIVKMLLQVQSQMLDDDEELNPELQLSTIEKFNEKMGPETETQSGEFFKILDKQCPGNVDRIWKLCKGKKNYAEIPFHKAYPNLLKTQCLMENSNEQNRNCDKSSTK